MLKKILKWQWGTLYILVLLIVTIGNIKYDFIVDISWIKVIFFLLYDLIACLGLYEIIKNKKKAFVVISLLLGLMLSFHAVWVWPLALLGCLLFQTSYGIFFRLWIIFVLLIMTLLAGIGYVFKDANLISVYDVVPGPRNDIQCVVLFHDAGATGGDLSLNVEKSFGTWLYIRKRLALIESYENIQWLDTQGILVDRRIYKVKWY